MGLSCSARPRSGSSSVRSSCWDWESPWAHPTPANATLPKSADSPARRRGPVPGMKAATYSRYGAPDMVTVKEVEKPSPKDKEVLIRIHATTVTSGDWRVRSLILPKGFGLLGRLIFG